MSAIRSRVFDSDVGVAVGDVAVGGSVVLESVAVGDSGVLESSVFEGVVVDSGPDAPVEVDSVSTGLAARYAGTLCWATPSGHLTRLGRLAHGAFGTAMGVNDWSSTS